MCSRREPVHSGPTGGTPKAYAGGVTKVQALEAGCTSAWFWRVRTSQGEPVFQRRGVLTRAPTGMAVLDALLRLLVLPLSGCATVGTCLPLLSPVSSAVTLAIVRLLIRWL